MAESKAHPQPRKPFPKGVLYAAAGMIVCTLVLVAVAQTTGIGKVTMPSSTPVQVLELEFADAPDGSVVATASDGRVLAIYRNDGDGFVRGVLRGMFRTRKLEDVPREPPFRLTHWANGQLSLEDPQTGRIVYLNAFGPTNLQAFARLLGPEREPQAMKGAQP